MVRKDTNHDEFNTIHNMELEQLNKCTFRYYGASHVRRNIPVIVKKDWWYLLIDLKDAP